MRDFRQLKAWQRAHGVAVHVCRFVGECELYRHRRLLDQLEGAAVSLPANIAEAWGRETDRDRARFLDYGVGSASELEAIVLVAHGIGIISTEESDFLCDEIQQIRRMLAALIAHLRPR